MKLRLIGVAMVVAALAVGASGCGRYSISNIRSLKAFQDANNLYKKAEYKAAIERYEASVKFNPELGFAYFFLGNSYDNLYKPAKKGEPENDANLTKAAENYRIAIQKMATATDPKEKEIRNLAFQYLIAVYGQDKLDDFSKAEPIARELIAAEPERAGQLSGAGQDVRRPRPLRGSRGAVQEGHRAAPEGGAGLPAARRLLQPPGQFRQDDGSATSSAPTPSRTTPRRGTPSAASIRTRSSATRSCRPKVGLEYTIKGLEAEDKALQLNPEYFEALSFKNILLRQQALYEKDPAAQKRLITEAETYYQKALEVQKKQNQGAAAAAAAARQEGQEVDEPATSRRGRRKLAAPFFSAARECPGPPPLAEAQRRVVAGFRPPHLSVTIPIALTPAPLACRSAA